MKKEKNDLGVRIGTPAQVRWEKVFKDAVEAIEQSKINLSIQESIRIHAEKQIEAEKGKL